MGGGYEFDTGCASFTQREYFLFKLRFTHYLAAPSAAYDKVLTIDAAKITSGEENGTRAALSRYAGLLPAVEHYFRNGKSIGRITKSLFLPRPVRTAFSWTYTAIIHCNTASFCIYGLIIQPKRLFFNKKCPFGRNFLLNFRESIDF